MWYDKKGLYAGVQWIRTIEREIESRQIFIIALSPDAITSYWVEQEFCLALSLRKTIVGVQIQEMELRGFIRNRQVYNAVGQTSDEAASAIWQVIAETEAPDSGHEQPSLVSHDHIEAVVLPGSGDGSASIPGELEHGASRSHQLPGPSTPQRASSADAIADDFFAGGDPFSLIRDSGGSDSALQRFGSETSGGDALSPIDSEGEGEYCTIITETQEELDGLTLDARYTFVQYLKAMKRVDGTRRVVASEVVAPNETISAARARLIRTLVQGGWEEVPSVDLSQPSNQFQRRRR